MKLMLMKLATVVSSVALAASSSQVDMGTTTQTAPIVALEQEIEEEITEEQIAASYTMVQKEAAVSKCGTMKYWCYRPYETDEELPLIIYLHGKDGCGSNLDKLLQIEGIPYYINNGQIYPNAVVIAPQCPSGSSWSALTSDVMELIEQVVEEENIDRSRISLTGASLGGIGTFSMAIAYPDYFSAIVPVCASVKASKCSVLTNVPVRIYHGTNDTGMGFSVETANEVINANGGDSTLTWIQGEGHEIRHVYVDEEYDIINWMISQQREDMVTDTEEITTETTPETVTAVITE